MDLLVLDWLKPKKNQIGGGAKKGQKKCTGGMFLKAPCYCGHFIHIAFKNIFGHL